MRLIVVTYSSNHKLAKIQVTPFINLGVFLKCWNFYLFLIDAFYFSSSLLGPGIQPPNNSGINPNQNQNRSHVNRWNLFPVQQTHKQQQYQPHQLNNANNNVISSLRCPSTPSSTAATFKTENLPHLSASVDVISGFGNITNNNLLNTSANSSIYQATKTGSPAYQALSQQSSAGATCIPHNGPSLHTMTIPTQNFPPSVIQTQQISTTVNNNTSTPNTTTNQNDAIQKNTVAAEAHNFKNHNLNTNKSFQASQTTSTMSSIVTQQQSSGAANLLFVRY